MAETSLQSQKNLATSIINFTVNTKQKKAASIQTASYFRTRLQLLEDYWAKFMDRNARLVPHEEELGEDEYFTDNYYVRAEEVYVDSKEEIFDDLERLRLAEASTSSTSPMTPQPVLPERSARPTLSVPTFDGKQEDWESFK